MSHEPIAYTYDADTHCPPCAEARFPRCEDGFIGCPDDEHAAADSEGNPVGAIFPWDEDPDGIVCGTCMGVVREGWSDDPDESCDCSSCRASDKAVPS